MEELLTIDETALYLRVSESTVRRMVKDGRIPATRIGRQWRVARAALEALTRIGEELTREASAGAGALMT